MKENILKHLINVRRHLKKIKTSSPQLKRDFAFMTAESYRFIEKYKEALKWYDKAIEFKLYETKPEIILHKANIHFMLGDVKQAKKSYTRLKKLLKNTKDPLLKLADNGVVSCKKAKEFELEQKRYIIKNENGLNKKSMDMASVVFGKGAKNNFTYPLQEKEVPEMFLIQFQVKNIWISGFLILINKEIGGALSFTWRN